MSKLNTKMSKSNALLLAENTEMRKQIDILSKSNAILLAENTEMRKQIDLLSKSNAILLIKFDFIALLEKRCAYRTEAKLHTVGAIHVALASGRVLPLRE